MTLTEHRTRIHEPEQDQCIRQTYPGQAGWAGWKAPDRTCDDCAHFRRGKTQEGFCHLYRERIPRDRAERKFPASALACREFCE